jgi:hypothetical protein
MSTETKAPTDRRSRRRGAGGRRPCSASANRLRVTSSRFMLPLAAVELATLLRPVALSAPPPLSCSAWPTFKLVNACVCVCVGW